jgi:hypothetical protein
VGQWVRSIEGLEADCHFFAEIELLSAAEHEEVLRVLFDSLALVGHE